MAIQLQTSPQPGMTGSYWRIIGIEWHYVAQDAGSIDSPTPFNITVTVALYADEASAKANPRQYLSTQVFTYPGEMTRAQIYADLMANQIQGEAV